jgi:uncharacterized membrane protein YedE/YeeE
MTTSYASIDVSDTSTRPVPRTLQLAAALVAGALFGFGLSYSTMIRPAVVLGFLRFTDLGLMLVLGGAVLVTLVAYRVVPRLLRAPLLGGRFGKHESSLSRNTIVGAAIFGIGWGITGVCPGPAIAGLGAGSWELGYAIAGIAIGALLQGWTASPPATS